MARPAFAISNNAPGSDLAAETAAALAAASMVYRDNGDNSGADEALAVAENLFAMADDHRGTYVNSIQNAGNFYK